MTSFTDVKRPDDAHRFDGENARSNGDLVAALNQGRLAAFETLYYRHRDWVIQVA